MTDAPPADPEDIISAYEALLARAIEIAGALDLHVWAEDETLQLAIDCEAATIFGWHPSSKYGEPIQVCHTCEIPAFLLRLPHEEAMSEAARIRAKARAAAKREQDRHARAASAAAEAREKAEFDRLKAKFEPPSA